VYSPKLLEHFHHPRHRRELDNPDAQGEARYPPCGDRLRLTMRIEEGRLTALGFTAFGCGAAKAAGSAATELLLGKTVDEARNLSVFAVDDALGGLPPAKRHALWMVLECLHEALGPRTQAEESEEN